MFHILKSEDLSKALFSTCGLWIAVKKIQKRYNPLLYVKYIVHSFSFINFKLVGMIMLLNCFVTKFKCLFRHGIQVMLASIIRWTEVTLLQSIWKNHPSLLFFLWNMMNQSVHNGKNYILFAHYSASQAFYMCI